jgi:hypothetical protein
MDICTENTCYKFGTQTLKHLQIFVMVIITILSLGEKNRKKIKIHLLPCLGYKTEMLT